MELLIVKFLVLEITIPNVVSVRQTET